MNKIQEECSAAQSIEGFKGDLGYQFEYQLYEKGIRVPFLQALFLEFFELVDYYSKPQYTSVLNTKGEKFNEVNLKTKKSVLEKWHEGILLQHIGSWIYQAAVEGLPRLQEKNNKLTLEKLLVLLINNEVNKLYEAYAKGPEEFHKKISSFSLIIKKHKGIQLDLLQSKLQLHGIIGYTNIAQTSNYIQKLSGSNFMFNEAEGNYQLQTILEKNPNQLITSFFTLSDNLHTKFLYDNAELIDKLLVPGITINDISLRRIKSFYHKNVKIRNISQGDKGYQVDYQVDGKLIENSIEENIILNAFKKGDFGCSKIYYLTKLGGDLAVLHKKIEQFRDDVLQTNQPSSLSDLYESLTEQYGDNISKYFKNQLHGHGHLSISRNAEIISDESDINHSDVKNQQTTFFEIRSKNHSLFLIFGEKSVTVNYLQNGKILGYQSIAEPNKGLILQSPIQRNPFFVSFDKILEYYGIVAYLKGYYEKEEIDKISELLFDWSMAHFRADRPIDIFYYFAQNLGAINTQREGISQKENNNMQTINLGESAREKHIQFMLEVFTNFADKVDYSTNKYVTNLLANVDNLKNEMRHNRAVFYKNSNEFRQKLHSEISIELGNEGFVKEIKKKMSLVGHDSKSNKVFSRRLTLGRIAQLLGDNGSVVGGKGILELLTSSNISDDIKKEIIDFVIPFFDESIKFQQIVLKRIDGPSKEKFVEGIKYKVLLFFKCVVLGSTEKIDEAYQNIENELSSYKAYIDELNQNAEQHHRQAEQQRRESLEAKNLENIKYNESLQLDHEVTNELNNKIRENNDFIKEQNKSIKYVEEQIEDIKNQIGKIESGNNGIMMTEEHKKLLFQLNQELQSYYISLKTVKDQIATIKANIAERNTSITNTINTIWLDAETEHEKKTIDTITENMSGLKVVKKELEGQKEQLRESINQRGKSIRELTLFGLPKRHKNKKSIENLQKIRQIDELNEKIKNNRAQISIINVQLEDVSGRIRTNKQHIDSIRLNARNRVMTNDELEIYNGLILELDNFKQERSIIQNTAQSILSISEKKGKYAEIKKRSIEVENKLVLFLYQVAQRYLTEEEISDIEEKMEQVSFYEKEIPIYEKELIEINQNISSLDHSRKSIKQTIEDARSTEIQKQILRDCYEIIDLEEKKISSLLIEIKKDRDSIKIQNSITDVDIKIKECEKSLKLIRFGNSKTKTSQIQRGKDKIAELTTKKTQLERKLKDLKQIGQYKEQVKLSQVKIIEAKLNIKETKALIREGWMSEEQKEQYRQLRIELWRLIEQKIKLVASKKGMRIRRLLEHKQEKPVIEYNYKSFKAPDHVISSEVDHMISRCNISLKNIEKYTKQAITEEEYQKKYIDKNRTGGGNKREYPFLLTEYNSVQLQNSEFPIDRNTLAKLCEQEHDLMIRKQKGLEMKEIDIAKLAYGTNLSAYGYRFIKQYFEQCFRKGAWSLLYRETESIRQTSKVLHDIFISITNRFLLEKIDDIMLFGSYPNKIVEELGMLDKDMPAIQGISRMIVQTCNAYLSGDKKIHSSITVPREYFESISNHIDLGVFGFETEQYIEDVEAIEGA